MDPGSLSSNWKKLQALLGASKSDAPTAQTLHHGVKRKRATSHRVARNPTVETRKPRKRLRLREAMTAAGNDSKKRLQSIKELEAADNVPSTRLPIGATSDKVNAGMSPEIELGRYVAVDCEMVGIGPNPERKSALARVSLVNYNGDQIYDSYVLPLEPITDYRTHVSGITAKHIKIARSFKEVQVDVAKILEDRVVVGHALRHDLAALMLSHPLRDIRDTSRHAPYRKIAGGTYPKLKILAAELLGVTIQEGEHSSIEDARACMMLFRKDKSVFEREHAKRWPAQTPALVQHESDNQTKPRKRKKKKKKH